MTLLSYEIFLYLLVSSKNLESLRGFLKFVYWSSEYFFLILFYSLKNLESLRGFLKFYPVSTESYFGLEKSNLFKLEDADLWIYLVEYLHWLFSHQNLYLI